MPAPERGTFPTELDLREFFVLEADDQKTVISCLEALEKACEARDALGALLGMQMLRPRLP